MEIEKKTKEGFILKLTVPDNIIRKGANQEMAQKMLEIAYGPFITKSLSLIHYVISTGDMDFLEIIEKKMSDIAKERLSNGEIVETSDIKINIEE